MKTLCDQLNETGDTITDKQLAFNLLASLLHEKYEALITSLVVQDEENLQFDRQKYLLLQSSDCEAFNESTKKDNKLFKIKYQWLQPFCSWKMSKWVLWNLWW